LVSGTLIALPLIVAPVIIPPVIVPLAVIFPEKVPPVALIVPVIVKLPLLKLKTSVPLFLSYKLGEPTSLVDFRTKLVVLIFAPVLLIFTIELLLSSLNSIILLAESKIKFSVLTSKLPPL